MATFLLATGGLLYEIYLGAFGSYLFGDSVKIFSLTTGVYMFSMGVGAYTIKSTIQNPLKKLITFEVALVLLHLLAPFLIWGAFVNGGGAGNVFWLTLILSGYFVGAEIPLVLSLLRQQFGSADRFIHAVLASDYFGALFASFLFGYFLLPKVGLIGTSATAAAFECTGLLIILIWGRSSVLFTAKKIVIGLFVLFLAGSLLLFSYSKRIQFFLENEWVARYSYGAKVIASEWTGYSNATLVEFVHSRSKKTEISLLLDRQFQWATGEDLIQYHEALTIPAIESFKAGHAGIVPARVLIIGGGDGFVANTIIKDYQARHITLVDIDKRISALALEVPRWRDSGGAVFLDPRLEVIHGDAFSYVIQQAKAGGEKFDLVVFDLPDPRSPALARFFTTFYFRYLSRLLTPGAVISIQASSEPSVLNGRRQYVCAIQAALAAAGFKTRVLYGDEKDYYVLATAGDFVFPDSKTALPGTYFDRGEVIEWYLADPIMVSAAFCPTGSTHSMLRPTLLDF